MKYCPKCGQSNEDTQNFCGSCGTDLTGAQSAPETVVEAEVVAEEPQNDTQAGAAFNAPGGDAYNPNFNATATSAQPLQSNTATLWLILNIALTVLCCGTNVLGIIGIIFAALGMSNYNHGDYAQMASNVRISRILFIVGIVLGVLSLLGFVIASVAGLFSLGDYGYYID